MRQWGGRKQSLSMGRIWHFVLIAQRAEEFIESYSDRFGLNMPPDESQLPSELLDKCREAEAKAREAFLLLNHSIGEFRKFKKVYGSELA